MNHLICLRCGHIFANKANLNKHYKRNNVCNSTYYEYTYKDMKQNHSLLKSKRIELILYIDNNNLNNNTKIKKPKQLQPKLNKNSDITYWTLKNKLKNITNNKLNNESFKDDDCLKDNDTKIYKCSCGKIYNHHSSLSRHKKDKHKKPETLLSKLIKNKFSKD